MFSYWCVDYSPHPSFKRQGSPDRVSGWGESEIFFGKIFLLGGKNLRWSDFDHLNLFQSYKQHSLNIEYWLKSKLAWPVCKQYKRKIKWYRSNDYSSKWSFHWVITWKLLVSGRIKNWGDKNLVVMGRGERGGSRWGNEQIFGYWGNSSSYHPSRENPERGEWNLKRENRWCQNKFI